MGGRSTLRNLEINLRIKNGVKRVGSQRQGAEKKDGFPPIHERPRPFWVDLTLLYIAGVASGITCDHWKRLGELLDQLKDWLFDIVSRL